MLTLVPFVAGFHRREVPFNDTSMASWKRKRESELSSITSTHSELSVAEGVDSELWKLQNFVDDKSIDLCELGCVSEDLPSEKDIPQDVDILCEESWSDIEDQLDL